MTESYDMKIMMSYMRVKYPQFKYKYQVTTAARFEQTTWNKFIRKTSRDSNLICLMNRNDRYYLLNRDDHVTISSKDLMVRRW